MSPYLSVFHRPEKSYMLRLDPRSYQCAQKLGKSRCTFTRKRKVKISPPSEMKSE